MRIFVDTEFSKPFTEKEVPELLSIGMIDENDNSFYAERDDYDRESCHDFVKENVLIFFNQHPGRAMPLSQLAEEAQAWLAQYEDQKPFICYDFLGDWTLMREQIYRCVVPGWINYTNINRKINKLRLYEAFQIKKLRQHHALDDAIANKMAYEPWRGS